MKQIRCIHVSLLAVLALATGCGDDDGGATPDAAASADAPVAPPDADTAPDATPPDAGPLVTEECPTTYGPTGISATFQIPPGNVGFDLDGDDEVDNVLGANATVRGLINNDFDSSLADGSLLTLAELRNFDGFGGDDPALELVLYGGVDTDAPVNPADNFSGEEPFYFSHEWVRASDCAPRAIATASFESGALTADADSISFYVDSLGGFVELANPHVEAQIEAATVGQQTIADSPALIGGAIVGCSLARADGPIGGSAQISLLVLMIQPDVDLDGDGLETIVGDINGITHCIDGDETIVEGELCGCDPRIADGYSIAFETDLVGATLLGPAPE